MTFGTGKGEEDVLVTAWREPVDTTSSISPISGWAPRSAFMGKGEKRVGFAIHESTKENSRAEM